MAVKVTVERKVIPGEQRKIARLLRELRSKAVVNPGFISGETVLDMHSPAIFMTISNWSSLAVWENWEKNPERLQVIEKINALLQGQATVRLWIDNIDAPPPAV